MLHHPDHFALTTRITELTDLLSDGLDPEFDAAGEELEREFQELRLHLGYFA